MGKVQGRRYNRTVVSRVSSSKLKEAYIRVNKRIENGDIPFHGATKEVIKEVKALTGIAIPKNQVPNMQNKATKLRAKDPTFPFLNSNSGQSLKRQAKLAENSKQKQIDFSGASHPVSLGIKYIGDKVYVTVDSNGKRQGTIKLSPEGFDFLQSNYKQDRQEYMSFAKLKECMDFFQGLKLEG